MKRKFVEISGFKKNIDSLAEGRSLLRRIQELILEDPKLGDVVIGTGGIRKLRVEKKGGGKRGGYRVWYLDVENIETVYLLTLYSKNESEDLSSAERKVLKQLVDRLKKDE